MVDVSADGGWLWTTLNTIELVQMVMQGQWSTDSTLNQLPCITPKILEMFWRRKITCLPEFLCLPKAEQKGMMDGIIPKSEKDMFWKVVESMPLINVSHSMGIDYYYYLFVLSGLTGPRGKLVPVDYYLFVFSGLTGPRGKLSGL